MRIPSVLLQERVTIKPFLGSGAYGPIWGDEQTAKAQVELGFRVVTNRQGQEVVASAIAFVQPGVQVGPESLVTWEGQTFEVIDALPMRAWGKTNHIELVLKSKAVDA